MRLRMDQPLFHSADISLEKVAYNTRLERDPDEWPAEIIKEAYKQLPFLRAAEVDVTVDRTDGARGYAIGKIYVYPPRMTKEAASARRQLVTVPVIIKEGQMSPLDVFSHEERMRPMAQEDIRGILFRSDLFQGVAGKDRFQGSSLSAQIAPPTTGGRGTGTLNKYSSDRSLWASALPTFRAREVEEFRAALQEPAVKLAYATHRNLSARLVELAEHEEVAAEDVRAARNEALRPTVVQFRPQGSGFVVKTANHACYKPSERFSSRMEVGEVLNQNNMDSLQTRGLLTLVVDPENLEAETVKIASDTDRFGVYKVRVGPKEVEGLIVPRMMDLEGTPLDSQIFASPDAHSIQEKLAGHFQSDMTLPETEPRGVGVFVYQRGSQAVATEPVEVLNKVASQEFLGKRLSDGTSITMTIVPGLRKVASIGQYHYGIPESFRFLPLKGRQEGITLETEVFDVQKVAGDRSIELISDGTFFSFRGGNAKVFGKDILDADDAEFALGSLGVSGTQADFFMKKASKEGAVLIPHTRRVVSEDEAKVRALRKVAAVKIPDFSVSLFREVGILGDLTKEASVVIDKESVDTILALNFITPENAMVYVDFIPELEKVSGKLAELLVASRLGMEDVRESAAKNAMTQMSSVLTGLETLRSRVQ
jgi:hypothetical protein